MFQDVPQRYDVEARGRKVRVLDAAVQERLRQDSGGARARAAHIRRVQTGAVPSRRVYDSAQRFPVGAADVEQPRPSARMVAASTSQMERARTVDATPSSRVVARSSCSAA